MNAPQKENVPAAGSVLDAEVVNTLPPPVAASPVDVRHEAKENRRWWIKLCLQPLLLLICGVLLILGLAAAQRWGLISAGGDGNSDSAAASDTRYICPMMCTPPQGEPGRCPVCAMELVPASAKTGSSDSNSIEIDPAARRVANIRTVPVEFRRIGRLIRAVGEISYDEGTRKSICAYVDGRIEEMYADYTGVVVNEGDHLALVYSPELYSGQIEYLLAKSAKDDSSSATICGVIRSTEQLFESSRQRLIELGMTEFQILELEQAGEADSRLHLCAPISGTVLEKGAVEGEYVSEGQVIYRLADLSTVWLMLELFPDDAASVHYGQRVEAEVESLPGQRFSGRVAFVDPTVDPETRTVGVRVVIDNSEGTLRIGDYAAADIEVSLNARADGPTEIFDPDLVNKWISPRHPHIVRDEPGECPICGIDLVPATDLGFTNQPQDESGALVVPRDAVLMAGNHSVVYVEEEPGRFELRNVVLGSVSGNSIVIVSGVDEGELVATRGNFLIDSQMQLAGNPSLIDPTKAQPTPSTGLSAEALAAMESLSAEDQQLAISQRLCPVADFELGTMGTPIKVDVNGTPVFICCEGCRERLLNKPEEYLAKLNSTQSSSDTPGSSPMHLPPIGPIRPTEPEDGLPPILPLQAVLDDDLHGSVKNGPLSRSSDNRSKEVVR